MAEFLVIAIVVLDVVIVVYFGLYACVNLGLLLVSSRVVPRGLRTRDLLAPATRPEPSATFYPLVSLIVPAFCEEVTIVANIRSLLRLDYPNYEIIVVNDGSEDSTLESMRSAFSMVRSEVDYDPHLGTMPIRGCYRATVPLPESVGRLVLLDKQNGGKADAINAGINSAQGAYVASMDADSLLDPKALEQTMRPILESPQEIVACGGQVALTNGCDIRDGVLTGVDLPDTWIERFQVVEYMRSFTQARTSLASVNALLILAGVFAIFRRDLLIEIGGFLTTSMRSRVGREYCPAGAETVCEDMEVVVRLHRYLYDRGRSGVAACLPFPVVWTLAPDRWKHLGRQRNRWYRGLWQVLWMHRRMAFSTGYGRIGLFALPHQVLFEALAPILEALGYVLLPLSLLAGVLSLNAVLAFICFALAFNLLLSAGSVAISIRRLRAEGSSRELVLLDYRGPRAVLTLVAACFFSNLGYRQFLLAWQLKGLFDLVRGRRSWDKFARQGFEAQPSGTAESREHS